MFHSEFSLTGAEAFPPGANGIVGQLCDGQNRIGQTNLPIPKGVYKLDNKGRESPHPILIPAFSQQAADTSQASWTARAADAS